MGRVPVGLVVENRFQIHRYRDRGPSCLLVGFGAEGLEVACARKPPLGSVDPDKPQHSMYLIVEYA
jgi:hypothetical protein